MTQNRIFKFNLEKEDNKPLRKSRGTRRSIDMDNEDDYDSGYQVQTANELIQGRNLFNQVQNKDALRIVATMLWDSNLANAVLEELLHNARFSMYGIHAKNIADQLRQEMNLGTTASYDNESTPAIDENQEHDKYPESQQQYQRQQPRQNNPQSKDITHGNYEQVGNNNVAQFELPPPQRPVSMANAKQQSKNQYSGYNDADSPQSQPKREFRGFVTNNKQQMNNNGNSYASNQQYNTYNRPNSASKPSQSMKYNQNQQMRSKYNNNNNLRTANGNGYGNNQNGYDPQSDHARYYQQQQQQQHGGYHGYKSTPEPISSIPEESADLPSDSPEKKHKGHSASVVFHDNIRDSQIMDDGANQYEHQSESDGGYEHDDGGYSDDNMPNKFSD